jgi:class 3 adenylate cyclase
MGLHTGTPLLTEDGYVGLDLHPTARIAAAGHGGQVLVSAATAALLEPRDGLLQGAVLCDLGEHRFKISPRQSVCFSSATWTFHRCGRCTGRTCP